MKSTGNAGGSYNLTLRSSDTDDEDDFEVMLRRLGTGLLVTELIGQGVNYVTGDYSRGASGFWVEGGRDPAIRSRKSRSPATCSRCSPASPPWAPIRSCAAARSAGSILVDGMTVAGS